MPLNINRKYVMKSRASSLKYKINFSIFQSLIFFGLSLSLAHADTINTTAEAALAVNTTATFTNVGVETFDAVSQGFHSSITSTFGTQLGSYSLLTGMSATITNATIAPAGTYGGAGGVGNYITTSTNNIITVTLNQNVNYFGIWISAMNNGNIVSLYNNNTLLSTFDSTSMAALVGNCSQTPGTGYCGNPTNQTLTDRAEP